jgi:ferredoxin
MDLPLAQVPLGRVHVIAERCKQCDFCISYCPTDVLSYSDDINAKGYHYPCPELAIYTTEVVDEEDTQGEPDVG